MFLVSMKPPLRNELVLLERKHSSHPTPEALPARFTCSQGALYSGSFHVTEILSAGSCPFPRSRGSFMGAIKRDARMSPVPVNFCKHTRWVGTLQASGPATSSSPTAARAPQPPLPALTLQPQDPGRADKGAREAGWENTASCTGEVPASTARTLPPKPAHRACWQLSPVLCVQTLPRLHPGLH